MDFDTLVELFKEWSGRIDLDDDTILLYLNSGQRFLDDLTDFQSNPSRYLYSGSIGQSFVSLTAQAKTIDKLNLIVGSEINRVSYIPLPELQLLSNTLPAYIDSGLPKYWTLAQIRKVSSEVLKAEDKGKLAIVESGTVSDKLGVLFNCPIDKDYTIDISGKFFSPVLTDVENDTFWSIQYPMTLIYAGLYKLDVGYKNGEGAKDWLVAIQNDLSGVDRNVAEQISSSISQMRG